MSDLFGLVTPRTSRTLSDFNNNAFCCSDPDLAEGPPSPPESSASSPIPSERVSAALNLLKDHRQGVLDACWTVLDLSPDDYDYVWKILATDPSFKGYVADKLRFVILLSFPDHRSAPAHKTQEPHRFK
jgi:hypothetical protein